MTALVIFAVAAVMLATGATIRRHADRVITEVLAFEQRQIERDRKARQFEANLAARWRG